MAFALSLLLNPEIADAVSARWTRLADAGLSKSMLDLNYPPHVTLAVYDALAVDAAVASLDRAFDNVGQIPVTLTDFSTFGTGSGVCYVALAPSLDLMRLHAATVAAISSAVAANIERLRAKGRLADLAWWQAQLDWVEQNGATLAATGV